MKAARTLDAAAAGVRPSGNPTVAGLHHVVTSFLEERPYGFTFDPGSPHDPASDDPGPIDGVCVTFDNTKYQWSAAEAAHLFPDGKATPTARALIRDWTSGVADLLGDGRCWVGGWRSGSGAVEINVTFVFKQEHETAAREFGALQGQEAVHRLADHEDLDTHGSGGSGQRHATVAQQRVDRVTAWPNRSQR